MTSSEYSKDYRKQLGFSSQVKAKAFLGAKDITPPVDFDYIERLNARLHDMVDKIDGIVVDEIKQGDLSRFKEKFIDRTYSIMQESDILPKLNNQGRRPEDVYFSWMRGHVLSNYFLKALGLIFEIDISHIEFIGDDDLKNIETFKRTPKADFEIDLGNGEKTRLEIQSGFAGINDIKQHKFKEAKRVFLAKSIQTFVIHFDMYNGQVAFVNLNEIDDKIVTWTSRKQMEGQTVFEISEKYFIWKIVETPIKYIEIAFG